MVSYGFKKFFAAQIEDGTKTHTIRGHRRRHAHVGEPVQLFQGLRTGYCRKIIDDPICIEVLPIVIMSSDLIDAGIAYIAINGQPLHRDEIEPFAASDGFDPIRLRGIAPAKLIGATARETMGRFWRDSHGKNLFQGVLIKWERRA
ncbi:MULTISPECIES: ASCH domain-containing protein [Rhizobium/Agrobacterium group]|uniref:ASCH domain-containing protein n=1 Tax=Rhizobium/Agrobacterium group TaxID=227290 RepID=UPI001572C4A9|nr:MULTISPECIES: ASCH domain-containing protein [Rhizobium/Agrobacterium group]MCF1446649.1 ASCH domain-containing protein [Allorhizobium ampelinum]NSZ53496.1 ASCH domain-containing protein [Agrobacterium vitis]NTA32255.1 ASCH domain-containing protein [Agrobacterium vitis]